LIGIEGIGEKRRVGGLKGGGCYGRHFICGDALSSTSKAIVLRVMSRERERLFRIQVMVVRKG
jgi:hypothetical protein